MQLQKEDRGLYFNTCMSQLGNGLAITVMVLFFL